MDKDVADLMRLDRAIFSPVQNIWPYKERKGGRPRAKWLETCRESESITGPPRKRGTWTEVIAQREKLAEISQYSRTWENDVYIVWHVFYAYQPYPLFYFIAPSYQIPSKSADTAFIYVSTGWMMMVTPNLFKWFFNRFLCPLLFIQRFYFSPHTTFFYLDSDLVSLSFSICIRADIIQNSDGLY